MDIIDELEARGLIKDFSNRDEVKELLKTPQTIYCGFDPSAKSMHLGNFVAISTLMRLANAGHHIIAVAGGLTGMIGDPSGKKSERQLLSVEQVNENVLGIKNQLEHFIKNGRVLNNASWLEKMTMIEFLRDYGKYFPINYMLNKEIVSSRLDSGISYTEFSYSIIQAIDFLHLFKNENCTIQIGGSDQWGNLTSGLELIRKVEGNEVKVGGFTLNLLLDSNGKKFGKSEGGALYLDEKMCSPYRLYQYLINTGDDDACRYLKVFSFKTLEEINSIINEHRENLGQRIAQKALAKEVVTIIHGEAKFQEVLRMSECLFSGDYTSLTKENLFELFGDYLVQHRANVLLEDLLIDIKASTSKREAREFIKGNSIAINGQKVTDLNKIITSSDALLGEFVLIKRGKKNFYLVRLTDEK